MADTDGMPEFQVHIVGHFCKHHQPLIGVYKVEGRGVLAAATLVATFPEGEEALLGSELLRYEHDMLGQDTPTRIIPDIMGTEALEEVMHREVMHHTREADEWVAKVLLGNLAGVVADAIGDFGGTYL